MNILTNTSPNINKIPFNSKKLNSDSISQRAPFYPETMEMIDKIYENYHKSLQEVPFSEINKTALKLAKSTQTPKREVLKAMQLLTQFSNMNDLKCISESLNKENLLELGNGNNELCYEAIAHGFLTKNVKNICEETGVHRSLTYLLDKKKLAPFNFKNGSKIGVILDEEKISQLEQVKKTQPEEFEELIKNKRLKFFYISGWDSGISIIDRTQNLEKKTKQLLQTAKEKNLSLEQALDYPYIDRIKEMGIKPIIIKNENEPTEFVVYNQMRPERIRTKESLYNIIEANTVARFGYSSNFKKAIANHVSAKYLDETLSVYTPEKMSGDLKNLNKKIENYAKKIGKEPLYVIPNRDIKSSDFLNYSYKKINKIDPSKFIYMSQVSNYFINNDKSANSFIVILDDCALSGNSMRDILSFNMDLKNVNYNVPILFANLKCSDVALNNFENQSGHPVDIMYMEKIKSKYVLNDQLEDIIGQPQYQEDAFSLTLPYMAPDNNSEFATNIALLHNSKYNSENKSSMFYRNIYKPKDLVNLSQSDIDIFEKKSKDIGSYSYCTKNISDMVMETSCQYAHMIGLKPKVFVDDSRYVYSKKEIDNIVNEIWG